MNNTKPKQTNTDQPTRCWLFHDWGRWGQYTEHLPARQITTRYILAAATEVRQNRQCKRCGKLQDELVRVSVTQ